MTRGPWLPSPACVTGFWVGTSISNAPTLDLSMDIVERNGEPVSKRGKFGGRKYAYRCPDCLYMDASLSADDNIRCSCGCSMEMIEEKVLESGKRTSKPRSAKEIRKSVLWQLRQISEL